MSQTTRPTGPEDQKNSEKGTDEKSDEFKNFEEFARKIFNVPPEELKELQEKEKRKRKPK